MSETYKLIKHISTLNQFTKSQLISWKANLKANFYKKEFRQVRIYCMFVGYPRSGHSLVGALLDAHPNIIIAHELDALSYLQNNIKRYGLFYLLLRNSQRYQQKGRIWNNYSYIVQNQWQGCYQDLRVIGDKQAGRTNILLNTKPELYNQLSQIIALPIKIIHVIRNPFDTITTMAHSSSLERASKRYFYLCEGTKKLKGIHPEDNWLDLKHENLIQNPIHTLEKLYNFLEEEASPSLLEDCKNIIYQSPHKSRYKKSRTDQTIQVVRHQMQDYPFLNGYTYLR